MYEDTPQELVHDLFSQAVFGSHALGRPVIGTAEVISTVSRRAIAGYHRSMYTGANIVVSAAGNITHDRLRLAARSASSAERRARAARRRTCAGRSCRRPRRACASSARTPSSTTSASARPASPAPTGGASPRRCSTRSSAARRRRASSRRSARSAAWRTRSTASRRSTPTPGLIGIYVGTREENLAAVRRDLRRADRRASPPASCARASSSGRRRA